MQSRQLDVQAISVKRLFNLYDHNIVLKTDGVTIIHGKNGVGKTVILSLLDAFFSGDWQIFSQYPFAEFQIIFDSEHYLSISQSNAESNSKKIVFKYLKNKFSASFDQLNADRQARKIERESPFLDQIGSNAWIDMKTGRVLSSFEVVSIYGNDLDLRDALKLPEWLMELKESVKVSFIKTQRLENRHIVRRRNPFVRPDREQSSSVVSNYAEKMKEIHAAALSDYGKIAQALDQTFPNRLLERSIVTLDTKMLKERMEKIESNRNRLKEVKVLEKDDAGFSYAKLNLENLSEIHRQVLSTYVEDSETKLKTLKLLSDKVELMLNKINKKFQHKKISLDSEKGLILHSDEGEELSLSGLSSGEQHELVLMFDLLFNTAENSIILIDEPELSLHISWQREFLDDLKDIISLNKVHVIVATHSPNIIEGYDHLMIELQS